ncbi:MAG TPA: DUF4197 domain-containing protein [Lentisphaeria bacterium]|nr:MAG: hypothetical protein A2X48_01565 [Lentisphaerae bacterium GWF2_49_21]HBC89095.1 DUF4197 domain-containing protein [Lentisphaeria bacterium]
MKSLINVVSVVICLLISTGCETLDLAKFAGGGQGGLSTDTIVSGLKEALSKGTGNAVAQTSKVGGYWDNPSLKILLPQELQKFGDTLRDIGLGSQVDSLEKKMNEGAEMAAKSAAPVFLDAIKNMSFSDAKAILSGNDTAATDFFRTKTSDKLKAQYAPIIKKELDQVGAAKLYSSLSQKYNLIPLAPKVNANLEDYVTQKALDGLFLVIAGEEKKIRQDPAARTTELLKKVFGK